MSPQLRPMRWWDIEPIVDLERASFDDPWSAELFWSELALGDRRTYLVAEDAGIITGYAGLADYGEEGYVQTLAVAATARRSGLGTRLLLALMDDAVRRGLRQVGLEVRVDNTAAQALYRRFGFAPVGIRPGYYQPSGADALVMIATGVDETDYAERLQLVAATAPA